MAQAFVLALVEVDEVMKKGLAAVREKSTTVNPFHCKIAPCYKHLQEGSSLKLMDDNLKIMIAGTTNKLGKLIQAAQETKTTVEWAAIVEAMHSNTLLEPMDDLIHRNDKLIKQDMGYFKFDGSPSKAVVNEVHSWFVSLIKDEDVLDDTKIDIDTLGAVVAMTGAHVNDLETLVYSHCIQEKEVMDIGVLRYPDIDHPYFKVYRIQLNAWADCERVLFVQNDSNGITGVFTCRKFKPRASVLAGLSDATKKKAIEEAEDLFP